MNNAPNLFHTLNFKLFELLSGLNGEQWSKNTSVNNLKIKDLAIQLLNVSRHNLSLITCQFDSKASPINLNGDFNSEVYLADLLTLNEQLNSFFEGNPIISGQIMKNEFGLVESNLLKYYAENWVLQQHIRAALATDLLLDFNFYYPFLEYCMRFLPTHFEQICPTIDTLISIEIVGENNLTWQLIRTNGAWNLTKNQGYSDTQVYIDKNIAWILFSGGIDIYEASQYWQVIGNQEHGRHILLLRPFDKFNSLSGLN